MNRSRPRIAALYPYDPTSPSRIRSQDTLRVLTGLGTVTVFAPDLSAEAVGNLRHIGCEVITRRDNRLLRLVRVAKACLTGRSITFAFYRPVAPSRDQLADFDLVFTERCMLPDHAGSLPVVVDMVDNFQHQVDQLARTAPFPRRLGYAYDSKVIRRDILALSDIARLVICTTRNECDGLQQLGVPATKLLQYLHLSQVGGFDGNVLATAAMHNARSHVAVFHGRQSYPANQAAAERLKEVASVNADWSFLVFGEGWPARTQGNMDFRGFQPELSLLLECSLGIYPVEVAVGVQNKVLEALAAGLPVLITPQVHGGLPDAVKVALKDRILVRKVAEFSEGLSAARHLNRNEQAAQRFRHAYGQVIQAARSDLALAFDRLSVAPV